MKLIDILVQELPKRGGWPEGVKTVCQGHDSRLESIIGEDCWSLDMRLPILASDHRKYAHTWKECNAAVVTREQYEAACNTWSGEGLPPVGVECEVRFKHDTPPKWYTFIALFVSAHNVVALVSDDEFAYHIDELSGDNVEFRPLRSKRDEAVKISHYYFIETKQRLRK